MAALVLALALALACARPAHAVPSAANSTIPKYVLLVGHVAGAADTTNGAFLVVVRDAAANPVIGRVVELRILNCPGARLSANTYQSGVTAVCATHGLQAVTDGQGIVRMAAVGGGTVGAAPGGGPCAQVFAAGVLLGIVPVAYLDLDGSGGVAINDLALWLADLGSGEPIGRSDFDGDGALGVNDLAVWLDVFGTGRSSESATSYCP